MAFLSVFYDFHDDGIKPLYIAVQFKPGELDWTKERLFIPLEAPFQRHNADELNDMPAATILLEDLIVHPDRIDRFGIFLPRVKERYGISSDYDLDRFIIRLTDIEEVLQLDAKRYYDWR